MPAKKSKRPAPKKKVTPAKKPAAKTPVKAKPTAVLSSVADANWRQSGLCAQAQADGVPCSELGRRCEECDKADAKFAR